MRYGDGAFSRTDHKVRVTAVLDTETEQLAELKKRRLTVMASVFPYRGSYRPLSTTGCAIFDFASTNAGAIWIPSTETSKPPRQGRDDARLVTPGTRRVHDAVLEEAERPREYRAAFSEGAGRRRFGHDRKETGTAPRFSDDAMNWDLYGYYYIRIKQERSGYILSFARRMADLLLASAPSKSLRDSCAWQFDLQRLPVGGPFEKNKVGQDRGMALLATLSYDDNV